MKKLKSIIVVSMLAICLSQNGFAQSGTVTGTVIDAATKEPLIGANILVVELKSSGAMTDIEGKFLIHVPVGSYSVKVSSMGYTTVVKTDIIVKTGSEVFLDLQLSETTLELNEVGVTADYFDKTVFEFPLEKAIKTVKLNAKIKADASNCSLLQPYPKLGITEYAIANGYLNPDFDFTTLGYMSYNDSPIKLKDGKKIKNLQKLYYIGIWFPWTIPILKVLINLPENNIVFTSIFKLTHAISYARYHQLKLIDVIKLGLKSRKLFVKSS